ncbi:MAG TPA: hypothetical protein VMS64_00700 [Candidatus Methylomirabilis sp.]|nr:hypothetical protein [Candidatus Methylomirabilis sp.]
MNEVEPFALWLQHTTPHQLLDRFRRRRLAQATGAVHEREPKVASDHRRHGGELPRRPAQPVQPGSDHRPDALRQRQAC